MQFHTSVGQSDANISAAINTAVSTGLKVHISKLDIRLNASAVKGVVYTIAMGVQQDINTLVKHIRLYLQVCNLVLPHEMLAMQISGCQAGKVRQTGFYLLMPTICASLLMLP